MFALVGTPMRLRVARAEEAGSLSALALRSKAYWGYDAAFLEACRVELTFSPATCGSGTVWVAERTGRLLGFSALSGTPPHGELAALFVDPPAIGHGVGAALLRATLRHAYRRGFRGLELAADPGAEGFYRHHGAERLGTVASGSIPGRRLPLMRFTLVATAGAEHGART